MLWIKYEQEKNKKWRAVLMSGNSKRVWKSVRTYKRKAGAMNAVMVLEYSFSTRGLN